MEEAKILPMVANLLYCARPPEILGNKMPNAKMY